MTLLMTVLGQSGSLILVFWLLGTNGALGQTLQALCERIHQSPQNLTLQAVSPLSDKLYLVLWDILYTVPFTDETVDSVRGTLTLGGIEPGTEWTQVPWLKSVVDSVSTQPVLVGLNIWVEPNGTADPSQDHSIHVLFRIPASDVDKMIEVAWINQKGHRKAPWGVVTDGSVQRLKNYKFVESVSCKPQLVMVGPSDSTETEMFLSYSVDNQTIQISSTEQSCPGKDTTRPVLTWRPVFGFIHSSVVHLWDTRNGRVILFDNIEDNKMPMTVPVRFVPFVEYFVYTFKAADQDSNLLWIIVLVILIVGGAAAAGFYWFYKFRHSKIAKNESKVKVAPAHKSKTHKSLAPSTTSSVRPNSTRPSSSSTKAPFKMETFTDPETSTTTTSKGKSLQVSSMLNATGEMCQSTAPGLNPFQAFMVSSNVEGLGSVAPKASKVPSNIQDGANSRISSNSSTSSTGFKKQNPTGSL